METMNKIRLFVNLTWHQNEKRAAKEERDVRIFK
jgi:hypothetical protein